jgi:Mitochondrial carrier protein
MNNKASRRTRGRARGQHHTSMIVIAPVSTPALRHADLFLRALFSCRRQQHMTSRRARQLLHQTRNSTAMQPAGQCPTRVSGDIEWARILSATAVAAVATSLSQLMGAPLDVAHRMARASNGRLSVPRALLQCVQAGKLFDGLPLHLMKRGPTKCLTVVLFEYITQSIQARRGCHLALSLSGREHLAVAASCGSVALIATYPLHLTYYALRKGVPYTSLLQALRYPRRLYAGIIPAVLSVIPAVAVEYFLYKSIRSHVSQLSIRRRCAYGHCESSTYCVNSSGTVGHVPPKTNNISSAVPSRSHADMFAVVLAAAAASSLAGTLAEPLKALSRKMAVDSVRLMTSSTPAMVKTAQELFLLSGPGEFWRGFRTRSLRYALSAATAKLTVENLKGAHRSAFPSYKARSLDKSTLTVCPPLRISSAQPLRAGFLVRKDMFLFCPVY